MPGVVDAGFTELVARVEPGSPGSGDTLFPHPLAAVDEARCSSDDSRFVRHESSQPAWGRRDFCGSVRCLFRALPTAPTGTARLCRGLANRYPAGERKLSETLYTSGTRNGRRFCCCQSTKPPLEERVRDSSRVSVAFTICDHKGPGLPGERREKWCGLQCLSVTPSRALSRRSGL